MSDNEIYIVSCRGVAQLGVSSKGVVQTFQILDHFIQPLNNSIIHVVPFILSLSQRKSNLHLAILHQ